MVKLSNYWKKRPRIEYSSIGHKYAKEIKLIKHEWKLALAVIEIILSIKRMTIEKNRR